MKTNEQIFEEIKTRGYISEQQISLLKRRGNHQNEDIFDYSPDEIDQLITDVMQEFKEE